MSDTLKEKLKAVEKERISLLNKIEKQEEAEKLPELKKKYEGKFFKFRNSSGSGDKWWLYAHCTKVAGLRKFIVNQFEVSWYGEATFHTTKPTNTFSKSKSQRQNTKRHLPNFINT